jgi:hypothetical protein
MQTEKSRNIPLIDFLEALQIEYIVAEIRSKIYYKPKDKSYWKDRVMTGKKDKITHITVNNPSMDNIFNSTDERDRVRGKIIKKFGLPNFHYKDDFQRLELEHKDFYAFFSKGAEIIVKTSETETEKGVIVRAAPDRQLVTVKLRGEAENKVVHINNISRLLL